MKAILSCKNNEITQDKLNQKFEDFLQKHPDLLEEAYIYLDNKKVK
jgi:hypothetical protein